MSLNSLHELFSARENNGSFLKIEWCVVQALYSLYFTPNSIVFWDLVLILNAM